MRLPVTEVKRLRLDPGDKLVVRADSDLTESDAARLQGRVRALLQLPDDFPLLILPPGMDIEIVSPS